MSVIGRLDEQVAAVLITPLTRPDAPAADAAGRAMTRTPAASDQPPDQHTHDDVRRGGNDAVPLPVWML